MMDEPAISGLVAEMRRLREAVGRPTYADLEREAHRCKLGALPQQTLSPVLRGERQPRWETVERFVKACRAVAAAKHVPIDPAAFDLGRWAELAEQPPPPATTPTAERPPDSARQPAVQYVNCNVIDGDHGFMNIAVTYGS